MQKIIGVAIVLLIGAGLSFVVLDRSAMHERAAERRALEARASELTARVLTPGSPLSCLDGAAGETIETACEKALFARPELAAAAVSYTAARLDLLADGLDYARKSDASFDKLLAGLRRSIELDRFGVAAQVLTARDGCTPDKCAAFSWVGDPGTLKSNMRARVFAQYIDRYRAAWNERETPPPAATAPVASAQPPAAPVIAAPAAPSGRYDFPSAASIPPVSIMNAEPSAQATREEAAGAAAAERKPPTVQRRPQNQASAPAAR